MDRYAHTGGKTLRKILLVFLIFSVLFLAAEPVDLYRLTIINKSGMPIAIHLFGQTQDQIYYLPVEKGDRAAPTEKSFTILGDNYVVRPYYIETYDPVYGFQCGPAPVTQICITRNTRIVFVECGQAPANPGEPGYLKYWFWIRGFIY